jgi:hypothetical protein
LNIITVCVIDQLTAFTKTTVCLKYERERKNTHTPRYIYLDIKDLFISFENYVIVHLLESFTCHTLRKRNIEREKSYVRSYCAAKHDAIINDRFYDLRQKKKCLF